MARNTGKSSEDDFEALLKLEGKRAYFHRFIDASDVRGLTGKVGDVPAQPSDYIIVLDGVTSFAEVKSTGDTTAFRFTLLRSTQSAAALQIENAGGGYLIFVQALALPGKPWFIIPYRNIRAAKDSGKSSIKWSDLQC